MNESSPKNHNPPSTTLHLNSMKAFIISKSIFAVTRKPIKAKVLQSLSPQLFVILFFIIYKN
jgi:hypothetical protein